MVQRLARGGATTSITALLLLVQVLAGVAVPLAHARKRETAPVAIEAHHDASCVVIHDEMRCALCMYASSRAAPQQVRSDAAAATNSERPLWRDRPSSAPAPEHLSSPPRAPPALLA